MGKEIIFATQNPNKINRFREYFRELDLDVSGPDEKVVVEEDGETPKENAIKKARAYFESTGRSTFAVDYGLCLEGLEDEQQPGLNVRRIPGHEGRPTDEELLKHYKGLIKNLGGSTNGTWISSIALVDANGGTYQRDFTGQSKFVSEVSSNRTEGEPLNSIQIDPKTGKYFTDLTPDEWLALQNERETGYVEFMKEHLDKI